MDKSDFVKIISNNEDIFNVFLKLDDDFSAGPDGIPSALLKMCGSILCKPLSIIIKIVV